MTVKRKTKKRKTRGKTKRRKKTRKNPNKTCVVIPNLPKKPMLCIYINGNLANFFKQKNSNFVKFLFNHEYQRLVLCHFSI